MAGKVRFSTMPVFFRIRSIWQYYRQVFHCRFSFKKNYPESDAISFQTASVIKWLSVSNEGPLTSHMTRQAAGTRSADALPLAGNAAGFAEFDALRN